MKLFKVLVCGGRKYFDRKRVLDAMVSVVSEHPDSTVVFIHGDAPGADTLCRLNAQELGYHAAAIPARWARYKDAAGPIRNAVMAALEPDLCIAFPGFKGTADMVKKCRTAGIPVLEIKG